ncbi:MAG TPA: hypothetical protein VEZ44_12520 [bacterium]|nr:hypothetical protein [bacterium]
MAVLAVLADDAAAIETAARREAFISEEYAEEHTLSHVAGIPLPSPTGAGPGATGPAPAA